MISVRRLYVVRAILTPFNYFRRLWSQLKKMVIDLIVGARPNFMKVAPIMAEMAKHPGVFEQRLIHTGQHYDINMSQVFFQDLELPEPDVYLGVGSAPWDLTREGLITLRFTVFPSPTLTLSRPFTRGFRGKAFLFLTLWHTFFRLALQCKGSYVTGGLRRGCFGDIG